MLYYAAGSVFDVRIKIANFAVNKQEFTEKSGLSKSL